MSTLPSFAIEWKAEPRFPARMYDVSVLVTDVEGLSDADLEAVAAKRRTKATPLIVVAPSLHESGLALTGLGEIVSVRAVPLPDQSLRDLLEDLAAVCGARALTKDLGFTARPSSAPDGDASPGESWSGLVMPDIAWSDVSESDLGRAALFQIDEESCSFACTPAPWLASRIEYLTRQADGDPDGLRRRLERLGSPLGDMSRARRPEPAPDPAAIRIAAGYASLYFVTDVKTYEAVLDRPLVLLSSAPVERLDFLMPLLQHGAKRSLPVVVVAPQFGQRALAAMVTNKLRGTVSCAAIALSGAPAEVAATLAELAAATGAEVLATADESVHPDWIGEILGSATRVSAGRYSSMLWPVGARDRASQF